MRRQGQHTSLGLLRQCEVTVLEDGRILLPSDVIKLLQAGGVKKLYLGRIPGLKALVLCPEQFWGRWKNHLETQFPSLQTHPGARAYTTPFKPIRWDSQGRISLPALASDHAGIKAGSTAVIFGKDYYMELWDEEAFCKMKEECEKTLCKAGQQQRDFEDSDADTRS